MTGTADISSDGVYRYTLTRDDLLERTLFGGPAASKGAVAWVMLNPSTADASENDRTISKCMKFTRTWGYNRLIVVNLFAYRATDPEDMGRACARGVDIVGPENDSAIARADAEAAMTICAWGTWEGITEERVNKVARILAPSKVYCLHSTKYNAPGHPLYLPDYSEPKRWRVRPEEWPPASQRRKR